MLIFLLFISYAFLCFLMFLMFLSSVFFLLVLSLFTFARPCNMTDGLNKTHVAFHTSRYNFGCLKYVPFFFDAIRFELTGINRYGGIDRNFSFDHMSIGNFFLFSANINAHPRAVMTAWSGENRSIENCGKLIHSL